MPPTRPQTHIRPVTQRARPLAPRHPNEKFGHTVNPKSNDHWEPTVEIRWYQSPNLEPPRLQQRWKCIQHTQSRTRPQELYFEWRDIAVVIEQAKSPTDQEGINKNVV